MRHVIENIHESSLLPLLDRQDTGESL